MKELEKMSITEIIDITNLYLTPRSLFEIWKDDEEVPGLLPKFSGRRALSENRGLADKLVANEYELYAFLIEHEIEISKLKFVMTLLVNYKERLKVLGESKQDIEEKELITKGIEGIRKLIKGIDNTIIHYNMSMDGKEITHLTILNTKEETLGISREDRNSNRKRLQELEDEIELGDIVQSIFSADIEYSLAFNEIIGAELRHMAEYNTVMKEYSNKPQMLDKSKSIAEIASEIDRLRFIYEIIKTIKRHIEEINIDKMLLCSAYRYVEGMEKGYIKKESAEEVKRRLLILRKNIKKNVKLTMSQDLQYTLKDFEQDTKRFIGKENITYLSIEETEQLKNALIKNEFTLTSLGKEKIAAINLERSELTEILKNNPDNYIYFLREEKCPYTKTAILNDIINAKKCSNGLLQLLCEKTDITAEEVRDLFDRGIISVLDLKTIREKIGAVITDEKLFDKYRESQEQSDKKIQLERYALAYRNTEIIGKTKEEIQNRAEEFITGIGEELEPSDLVQLYGLDIIPLKVAVDWGGEYIIEELLQSGKLKPADAKYLRNEGLLNEEVLERLFQNNKQMVYSDQVSLVSAVYDGQTPEEQEIREKLAQYYNIESGMINSKSKTVTGKKKGLAKTQEEQSQKKIKMRDPGAKYNFLSAIDKDVTVDSGIIDGHIIFHYPNIENGTVLIEKLHKISTNKENGQIEIKADNAAATYVLSEEEFIKMKSELIQNGKIDRTQLTRKWWETRDPEHWIPHNGLDYWERAIMERFDISHDNTRYTEEDLKKIQELKEKSIESKKIEER